MNDFYFVQVTNFVNEFCQLFNSDEYVSTRAVDEFFDRYRDITNLSTKFVDMNNEQRKAILIDEDYSLVVSGSGSGKTTTMTPKVKYLVEKKKSES